jgi:hypothetical protein
MNHMFNPFIIKLIIVLLQLSATSKLAQRYSCDSASHEDSHVGVVATAPNVPEAVLVAGACMPGGQVRQVLLILQDKMRRH